MMHDVPVLTHSLSHKLRSERVSKQTNERNGARKQREQCSTRMKGVSKQASGRASGLIFTSGFMAHQEHSGQLKVCLESRVDLKSESLVIRLS